MLKYLGGGTNLVDLMRETVEAPSALVDVTGLSTEIEETDDGGLMIGAATRNTTVAEHPAVRTRYPMLTRAIVAGASAQIRNMATVGGNLLQRTRCTYFYDTDGSRCNKRSPGQGCDAIEGFNRIHAILGASPACVATHPSDMCVALAALDAVVHLRSASGERTVALCDLHRLPEDRPDVETVLEPGELITAVQLPQSDLAAHSTYRKVRDRSSYAFALVSVAAALELDGDTIAGARLALGGVAPKPWRAWRAEEALRGRPATEASFLQAADAELADRPSTPWQRVQGRPCPPHARRRPATADRGSSPMSTAESRPAVAIAREGWTPNAGPDPVIRAKRGLIGAQVSRLDGPLKVRGEARFAAEYVMEGMVYAALRYSTIARGRITTLDTRAAEAAAGIVLVMTHRNAPRMQPPPLFLTAPQGGRGQRPAVMQDDSIHWNGEPVAVVLAETQEQADHAASLIKVAYESSAPRSFEEASAHPRTPDSLVGQPVQVLVGDAEAALEDAPHSVDLTYRTPRHNHNAIEPHAVTLAWDGDDLIVHDASQGVKLHAWTLAQVFEIDESQVHLTSPYVGGGFGGKTLWSHHLLGAAASKLAGRPVRVTLSREGVYRLIGGRTNTEQRVAIGADDDGRFTALIHTGLSAMTAHNALAEQFTFPARHMYATETLKTDQQVVDMDMLSNSFMRAPGESVGTFALESAIDELAIELDLDPIELRIHNEPDKDPSSGLPFSARHLVDAWRAGAERFGWERRTAPGTRREGEWLIGTGCASATYPYHRFPGAGARITLAKTGHATVEVPANDMGMGTSTTQTIITAERLGLPLERVTVAHGDSSFPGSMIAGGSSQTASIAGAVIAAQRALVEHLLALADDDSPLAGLTADEVGGRDEGLCELADPTRWESYSKILERAGRDELTVVASAADPEEMQTYSMHSFGAVFCEVRVNTVTGETRVDRVLGSYDCGRIINPKTAASQFRGGIIMGIGLALMEDTEFDERTARIMNPSLAEYHVPVHMDVPRIEVMWTDIPDPYAPAGARGIGEIGITGVAAAVANAIYNASGRRVRDLPITLDKLL